MKKILFLISLLTILTFTQTVRADEYGCNGQYGGYGSGCPSNQALLIDKTVAKPDTIVTNNGQVSAQFVDNLSSSDVHYKPSDYVYFQLKVKNTSNQAFNVTIKDTLPSNLEPVNGPGTYDANSRIITIAVGTLNPGDEKTYTLKTQLSGADKLPADQNIVCLVNKAEAQSSNAYDSDNSQFCVEKQVTGVTKVPSAGPEMGIALFLGESSLLGVGLFLKKKLS